MMPAPAPTPPARLSAAQLDPIRTAIDALQRPCAPASVRQAALERWPRGFRGSWPAEPSAADLTAVLALVQAYLAADTIAAIQRLPPGAIKLAYDQARAELNAQLLTRVAKLKRAEKHALAQVRQLAEELRSEPESFIVRSVPGQGVVEMRLGETAAERWCARLSAITDAADPGAHSLRGSVESLKQRVDDQLKASAPARLGLGTGSRRPGASGAHALALRPDLEHLDLEVSPELVERTIQPTQFSVARAAFSGVVGLGFLGSRFAPPNPWFALLLGAAMVVGATVVIRTEIKAKRQELEAKLRDGLIERLRKDAEAETERLAARLLGRVESYSGELLRTLDVAEAEDQQLWLDIDALSRIAQSET